jgi:hypothetical protein
MPTKKKPRPDKAPELPANPWPGFESPNRIFYHDRPELPEDVYRKAGRHFTAAAFEEVKATLSPPQNFDLLARLQRAAFDYHFFNAAQAGEVDLIEGNRPKQMARAFEELEEKTAAFLKFCESNPGAFLSVADPPGDWLSLLALLKRFKMKAAAARTRIKTRDPGRPNEIARRIFQTHLLTIFEKARREPMTSRTGINTDKKKGEPYGPAFDFFTAAFRLIGLNLSPNSVNKYLKDTIRKRDKIKPSKLFRK